MYLYLAAGMTPLKADELFAFSLFHFGVDFYHILKAKTFTSRLANFLNQHRQTAGRKLDIYST
jgi:hypothetical protein